MLPRTFWISNDVIWMRGDIRSFSLDCHANLVAPNSRTHQKQRQKRGKSRLLHINFILWKFLREHGANMPMTFIRFTLAFINFFEQIFIFLFRFLTVTIFGAFDSIRCHFFSAFIHRTSFFVLKKETTFLNWFFTTLFFFRKNLHT